jgi:predicted GH43/DUF377 family glycosyl hydrolase
MMQWRSNPVAIASQEESISMVKLTRYEGNPILKAEPQNPWEAHSVFNAAAVLKDGKVYLFYRACDRPNSERYVSSIGLATSDDGFHFARAPGPAYAAQDHSETRGVEDPRITLVEGKYRMLYTAWDGRYPRVAMAESDDLLHWKRYGIILPHLDNKDSAIFSEKIGGRYCLIHREPPSMWLAWSDDCYHWGEFEILAKPRPNTWEHSKIGLSGPPVRIPEGWLVVYHGVDKGSVYRQSLMLLDAKNPRRILRQHLEPIIEPEAPYELYGDVKNVVFSCGHIVKGDTFFLYYGGADTVMAVATCPMAAIRAWAQGKD